MEYEAVIGLEVHAQIHTRSKMFCGCQILPDTGDLPPNTAVCPVCLGLPGALPVTNRRAVEIGMLAGLALNCQINAVNVFARKSYFYPDLPKGYQISQFELPLAINGYIDIETDAGPKRIAIRRAHLEEDAGKLYHLEDGRAAVDLNRAGVPLLEIVSEPDMRSIEEVLAYATALREILVCLGVNSGDMEKGMMRFEANISVRPRGATQMGTRTEVKNLNSFRALTQSTAYELERQISMLEAGEAIVQQTLGWDEAAGRTYPQRSKEYAHDYRYFPEPDIPPLHISEEWLSRVKAMLPELPRARRARLVSEYQIRPYDAQLLVEERAVADYFELAARQAAEVGVAAQEVANWITGDLFRLLNEHGQSITGCRVSSEALAELLALRRNDVLSAPGAKQVLTEAFETGERPAAIVERLGLAQISDRSALEAIIASLIDENPEQVQRYLEGKQTLIGWFVGQAMKATQGRANPQDTRRLLEAALEKKRSSHDTG